jgi:hypothetical protein
MPVEERRVNITRYFTTMQMLLASLQLGGLGTTMPPTLVSDVHIEDGEAASLPGIEPEYRRVREPRVRGDLLSPDSQTVRATSGFFLPSTISHGMSATPCST